MPFLSAEQAAALVGATVRVAMLTELQFASRTMRVWNGAGIITIAGYDWEGLGDMGSIDGLTQTREPTSSKVTMRLSGVNSEILTLAARSTEDVQGRPAYVWLQLFDGEWQPIGARLPIFAGRMQRITIQRSEASDLSGGERICALEVENVFAARSRPSAGRWTDADQQSRQPGDRFFQFVPAQREQKIIWPIFPA